MERITRALWMSGLSAMFMLVAGCGSSYCKSKVECDGGNDADQEVCEIDLQETQELSELNGCGDAWSAYIACAEEKSTCEDGVYTLDDACETEAETYFDCIY